VNGALPGHARIRANSLREAESAIPLATDVDSWRMLQAIMRQDRQRWLVNLRWVAIVGVIAVVGVTAALGALEDIRPLFVTILCMAAYNLVFQRLLKTERDAEDTMQEVLTLFVPILCDLAALTLLLHWSGGVRNPFALFFTFHMAIGATLLSTRLVYVLGAIGSLFWGGVVLLEHWGVLLHHPLMLARGPTSARALPEPSGMELAGYLTAFTLTLFGVIYFVRSVERGRWEAEAKAFQREKLALSRDRMARIGEISAGVAHTVRNPLQGVIGCLDLLRDGQCGQDDGQAELIDMMDEGLQRVERVTRRLLALTRERHLAMEPTDVNELIRESLRFLDTKASAKGIELETRLNDLPLATVDPDALGEVMMNLVDNAIDACAQHDRVLIETSLVDGLTRAISISVRDTGAGIPDEYVEKVFDPFFTTKAVGEGSGLGLAIVREIVADHMGAIRILRDAAWGTCFNILIPVEPMAGQDHGVAIAKEQNIGPGR
jgi:signal transduction histidine kinase